MSRYSAMGRQHETPPTPANTRHDTAIVERGRGGERHLLTCAGEDAARITRALEYWDVYGEADLARNRDASADLRGITFTGDRK